MKQLSILLCLIAYAAPAQTLEEQPLGKCEEYFTYEPSFIRENKIASLTIYETELTGDSVTLFPREKESNTFRKDGRPLHTCFWTDSHRDSVWTDFKYDSLGNLIEMNRWRPSGLYQKNKETERVVWKYDGVKLTGVFRYNCARTASYLTLVSCDSVIYSEQGIPAEIWTGVTEGIIPYMENPVFIYPVVNKSKPGSSFYREKNEKRIYVRDRCTSPCNYFHRPALQKLSEVTGIKCVPCAIEHRLPSHLIKVKDTLGIIEFVSKPDANDSRNVMKRLPRKRAWIGMEKSSDDWEAVDTVPGLDYSEFIRMDTNLQKIRVQTVGINVQPTSMEDIVTYTRMILHYDFSFNLLLEEVYQADLGRQYGHSSRAEYKSHETLYQYFDNRLQKQSVEIFELLHKFGQSSRRIEKTTTQLTYWD